MERRDLLTSGRSGGPEKDSSRQGVKTGRLPSFLREEDGLDVGQHTTFRDGDAREKLIQLLIITGGQLQHPRARQSCLCEADYGCLL